MPGSTANILALQISAAQPQQTLPWDGVPWDNGLRAMLSVSTILANVQTTVFFGNSLYLIWYNVGQLTPQDAFSYFLKPYYNRPMTYAQLSQPPYAAVPAKYRALVQTPPPPPPVATGQMTLLNSGFDPLRGYWMEFLGNYFLAIPIFQGWANVTRGGPNYTGFQPSQNNPSGSGSGGNTNGGCQ
jgi:hypothetical protein